MVAIAVVIGVVIFLNGDMSGSQLAATDQSNSTTVATVPFTEIARGTQSAVIKRVNYLITSDSELSKLWEMVNASGRPPVVDFNKQAVVAIFSGLEYQPSSTVTITKIEDTNARTVSVKLEPCVKSDNANNYQIVVMPLTSLPLTHKDESITSNCQG